MKIINTTDLKNWAEATRSNGELPELVKDLIRATTEDIKSVRFPDGDSVSMPGYDGVLVVNDAENENVPQGLSVWEMGTGEEPKTKANKDYEKRTGNDFQDRGNTTFVFVTPRRWNKKDEWMKEKKAEEKWKDVKALDAVDLQEWLEKAPAIALRFAQSLGLVPPEGVFLLEEEWKSIKCRSTPNIVESLATAGREKACQTLIERLTGPPHSIVVQGDSPQEAEAFIIATLLQIDEQELKRRLLSRTIVVTNQEAAKRLTAAKPLIVVTNNEKINTSALPSNGHHVIKPIGTDALNLRDPVKLPRPDSDVFGKELEKMGMEHNEAKKVAKICARSVTVFQRLRPSENAESPIWANDDKAPNLIPAMLAGRWDSNNDHDKNILCRLYECEIYEQVEDKIQHFLSVDEAPLQRAGNIWSLTAPADAFLLMVRHVSRRQFKTYKEVFVKIMGEIDPMIKLTPDERMYASMKNVKLRHSEWIRRGLAETLLLISQVGPSINNIQCPGTPEIFANEIMRSIPNLDSWDLIASLRDQYSILVEATPDPLLEALEKVLEGNPEGFQPLTEERRAFLGGHSLHTGLLWGLETLAWDPQYLKRVSVILAKLALHDPGGKLSNRPINSLREIFLSWHPGTNANLKQRIEALELVTKTVEEIAWPLIENLLPEPGSFSSGTSQPSWREAGRDQREKLTYGIVWQAEDDIISRAIKLAGNQPARWEKLLSSITRFPENIQKEVIGKLKEVVGQDLEEEVRFGLWSVLRDFVNHHLSYQDAERFLDRSTLQPFEEIIETLEPTDLIEKYMWLFNDVLPNLPNITKTDFEAAEREVKNLRSEAAINIIQKMGNEGIIRLAKKAELKGLVSSACISHIEKKEDAFDLITQAAKEKALLYFITHLSGEAYRKFSVEWEGFVLEKIEQKKDWSFEIRSHLFLFWPACPDTWKAIENTDKETESEYWKRVHVFKINGTEEEKKYQIEKLLKVDRSKDVFDSIAFHDKGISSKVIIEVARSVIKKLNEAANEDDLKINCPSHAEEFLKMLQSREDIDENDKAALEYAFLPLLGYFHNVNLTLYDILSKDPFLFAKVVCDVYKADSEEHTSEPNPQQQSRAQHGYRLLKGWHTIPGLKENGSINSKELIDWIESARELCHESDRADIGDQCIGNVLAHADNDPTDGAWPHRAVRKAIEHVKSEKLEIGLSVERFNMRGTYSKAMYEGGHQERELAERYRNWAEECLEWPRTHRLLLNMAKEWESDAKREDERAQQDRIRYS